MTKDNDTTQRTASLVGAVPGAMPDNVASSTNNPAQTEVERLRLKYVAAAVVLVDSNNRVEYWTAAESWLQAGILAGGLTVANTGLATDIDAHSGCAKTIMTVPSKCPWCGNPGGV